MLRPPVQFTRELQFSLAEFSGSRSAPGDVVPFERDGEFYIKAEDLPKAMHFKAPIGPVAVTSDGKVEGKFTAVVVLEESGLRGMHITLLAERLCQAATTACKKFTPFFNPHVCLSGSLYGKTIEVVGE